MLPRTCWGTHYYPVNEAARAHCGTETVEGQVYWGRSCLGQTITRGTTHLTTYRTDGDHFRVHSNSLLSSLLCVASAPTCHSRASSTDRGVYYVPVCTHLDTAILLVVFILVYITYCTCTCIRYVPVLGVHCGPLLFAGAVVDTSHMHTHMHSHSQCKPSPSSSYRVRAAVER